MPESVLSRLARSTELSKTESHSAGAARIQSRRTRTRRIRLSSKPYKHTLRLKPCQPTHPTGFPNVFHIGKVSVEGALGEHRSLHARNRMAFRLRLQDAEYRRTPEAED